MVVCCSDFVTTILRESGARCSRCRFPIVTVHSGVAFGGSPHFMHYVASKGAVVSMTRAMARELAEMGGNGLTANVFIPAAVAGEASDRMRADMQKINSDRKGDPLAAQIIKRRGTADDMVGPVLYMVSDASDFVTGSVVTADGGATGR